MAELFLAQHTPSGDLVVIKRILPYLSHEAEFVQMFLDEARIAAQLHHPNIIQVFELGKLQDSIFIAMEYVEGVDLRKIFQEEARRAQTMPYEIVAFATAQVCAGLAYAHTSRGVDGRPLEIVHRDVSPQNVMVSFDGTIKLVDFGIAKAGALVERSKPGVIKGKFLYLSPEQLTQERLDHRADLFAVGTMMYELTTGKAPFYKPTTEAVIYAIRNDEPVPPHQARPGFPPELSRIILKCLVKDRNRRYQNAADVQRDLEAFVQRFHPLGQVELSSYVGQLFGTDDERTMLHIPDAGLGRQPANPPLSVGRRPTSVADATPDLDEPPTRPERPPASLARPSVVSMPVRRSSGVRYVGAGEEAEPTHTTEALGRRPDDSRSEPMGEAPSLYSTSSLPPQEPTFSQDPVFDETPDPPRFPPGHLLSNEGSFTADSVGGRTDPTSRDGEMLESTGAGDDEVEPTENLQQPGRAFAEDPSGGSLRPAHSRVRSILVFAVAFTVVLLLGLLGLFGYRLLFPTQESDSTPGHSPEAFRIRPRPPGAHDAPGMVPLSPEGEAGAPTPTETPGAESPDPAPSPEEAPDASVALPPEPVQVPILFRAPRGTLVLHQGQRVSLGEPHDVAPGLFEYSYQCPGKRFLINASVRVAPQGGKPQVVTLGCRPRR